MRGERWWAWSLSKSYFLFLLRPDHEEKKKLPTAIHRRQSHLTCVSKQNTLGQLHPEEIVSLGKERPLGSKCILSSLLERGRGLGLLQSKHEPQAWCFSQHNPHWHYMDWGQLFCFMRYNLCHFVQWTWYRKVQWKQMNVQVGVCVYPHSINDGGKGGSGDHIKQLDWNVFTLSTLTQRTL